MAAGTGTTTVDLNLRAGPGTQFAVLTVLPPQTSVQVLAEQRYAARKAKEWAQADRLRAALHAAGWEMEDRADGYALKPRADRPA